MIGETCRGRTGAGAGIRVAAAAALEDSPLLLLASVAVCGRLPEIRGLFSLRSVGGGVASRGVFDLDLRFLPLLRGR